MTVVTDNEVERVARAIFDVEYSDGRPVPQVEPPWSVCMQQARAALSASDRDVLVANWQPIETAPKDTSWFLVWAPAAFEADVHVVKRGPNGEFISSYSDDWGPMKVTGTPTYWMPLPNSPAALLPLGGG